MFEVLNHFHGFTLYEPFALFNLTILFMVLAILLMVFAFEFGAFYFIQNGLPFSGSEICKSNLKTRSIDGGDSKKKIGIACFAKSL